MPGTSETLQALIRILEIYNGLKPVIDGAIDNEASRLGLSRAERYALTKHLTSETDTITEEDMGSNP